jgi:hypothetical protein
MPTILGSAVLDRAGIILQDTTNIRWPTAELLGWLNDGQREIVLRKPDAYTKSEAIVLTASETKQSIPAAGIQLIDVVRNMGTGGATPGRAITRTERYILDSQRPDWNTETGTSEVKHYMFDERNPKYFYVYPPQGPAPGYVEAVYSSAPAELATAAATLTLDDVYSSALLDYVLYRAYSKDSDIAPNAPQRAVGHYEAFLKSLGAQEQAESRYDPNMPKPSEAPGVHRG